MASWSNLQELVNRVQARLQSEKIGSKGVDRADVQNVVESVIMKLSRLAPRVVTDTINGDGSSVRLALSGLSPSWVIGFSTLNWVEHPVDDNPPTIIDGNERSLWPAIGGETHIQFLTAPANGTDNIRVCYTVPHTISDSATTVPDGPQRLALELFGVCAVAEVYAARANHNLDSGIPGDATDYQGQASRWHEVAEKACSEGSAMLGAGGGGIGAGGGAGGAGAGGGQLAAAWADFDPKPGPYGSLVWRSNRRR